MPLGSSGLLVAAHDATTKESTSPARRRRALTLEEYRASKVFSTRATILKRTKHKDMDRKLIQPVLKPPDAPDARPGHTKDDLEAAIMLTCFKLDMEASDVREPYARRSSDDNSTVAAPVRVPTDQGFTDFRIPETPTHSPPGVKSAIDHPAPLVRHSMSTNSPKAHSQKLELPPKKSQTPANSSQITTIRSPMRLATSIAISEVTPDNMLSTPDVVSNNSQDAPPNPGIVKSIAHTKNTKIPSPNPPHAEKTPPKAKNHDGPKPTQCTLGSDCPCQSALWSEKGIPNFLERGWHNAPGSARDPNGHATLEWYLSAAKGEERSRSRMIFGPGVAK